MAFARFSGFPLKRDRVELVIVAFGSTAEHDLQGFTNAPNA
jgi:hypothetical protein